MNVSNICPIDKSKILTLVSSKTSCSSSGSPAVSAAPDNKLFHVQVKNIHRIHHSFDLLFSFCLYLSIFHLANSLLHVYEIFCKWKSKKFSYPKVHVQRDHKDQRKKKCNYLNRWCRLGYQSPFDQLEWSEPSSPWKTNNLPIIIIMYWK